MHLGYGSLLNLFYFPSELNAADDPTKDRPVRKPKLQDPPEWLADALEGDFDKFDLWLAARNAQPEDAVGLPPVSSLVDVDYRICLGSRSEQSGCEPLAQDVVRSKPRGRLSFLLKASKFSPPMSRKCCRSSPTTSLSLLMADRPTELGGAV